LDSTTIDLCLSLFPWAKFRKHKAAVKMHTLLDLHGNIPTFIRITDGKVHDVNILDEFLPEAGAFYVRDRFLASEGEGMTWMRQPSRQAIALFSVRTEFWRSTAAYPRPQKIRDRALTGVFGHGRKAAVCRSPASPALRIHDRTSVNHEDLPNTKV
jgi:hypothetical protein